MGLVWSSTYRKDQASRDKKLEELESKIKQLSEEHEKSAESISKIQASLDNCCKSIEQTSKRMAEILIQEQKEAREERNLNREDRKRHKEDMELLIKSFADNLSYRWKLGFPATVDEWMARFPAKDLQSKISDKRIMKISKSVNPRKIVEVGLILGLTDNDIQQIKIDYGKVAEQSYQIIIKWKHKMGQKATVRHLLQNIFRAVKEDPTIINVDQLNQALLEK